VRTVSRRRVKALSAKDQNEEGCLWGTSRSWELMMSYGKAIEVDGLTREAFQPSRNPFNGLVIEYDVNFAYVHSRQSPIVFTQYRHPPPIEGTTLLLQVLIRAFYSPRPTIVPSLPAPQRVTATILDVRAHHVPCANRLLSTSSAHAPEAVS
jgi:hypothetical protein